MNPTLPNQSQQQPQQPFLPHHNRVYETLRSTLMDLHSKGIPGMDKVINALNQSHVSQIKPKQPQGMPQGVMGGVAAMPGSLGAMQEASQVARGLPLLSQLDQASRTGDQNVMKQIAQAILSNPLYKPYWNAIQSVLPAAGSTTLDAVPFMAPIDPIKKLFQRYQPQQTNA